MILKWNRPQKMPLPTNFLCPPSLKKLPEFFLMTSHLDSHTTTDVQPDLLSGVQTRNGIPHDRYNVRSIPMCTLTEKTTFSCKDNCTTKHTRHWTYSTLWYFYVEILDISSRSPFDANLYIMLFYKWHFSGDHEEQPKLYLSKNENPIKFHFEPELLL